VNYASWFIVALAALAALAILSLIAGTVTR
jgi:hypothetical protein